MSGLNPFRPKKPEGKNPFPPLPSQRPEPTRPPRDGLTLVDLTAHRHQPHSSLSITSPPNIPDSMFLGHPLNPPGATDQTNLPSRSASASTTPPPTASAPDPDESVTSDDQSTSDPFSQDVDVSDYEAERAKASSEAPATASFDVQQRHQGTTRTTTPSSQSSTETGHSGDQNPKTDNRVHCENGGELRESMVITSSLPSRQTSASMGESGRDGTADEPPPYTHSRRSSQSASLEPGIDPNALATRSGNRDRVPPPPPKSHHGKLISPDLSITPPASQTAPGKASSRVSFHGTSPGPLVPPPRIPKTAPDYFGTPSSQSTAPTDTLRRSKSQYKRPPTPPLSRRHSQMRRSKSTLSKPSSSQLSESHSAVETTASTPSSPGSRSLTPSLRSRDSRSDQIILDDSKPNFILQTENITPSSMQPTEVSLGTQPNPRTASKRSSLLNTLPPPPPPRRTRGSNHSNDNDRPVSLRSEQRAGESGDFVSHPSNATDILADLSRLQKEVDDLRGHYENRRAQ